MPGTEVAVIHYLLRFRFPHFDPLIAPDMAGIPSIARSFLVHLQHVNTVAELPCDLQDEFRERFVLDRDELVLEAGPYLGFGTVRLATRIPKGRVVSAEPMCRNFETATRNVERNGLSNATVHQLAIGAFDGEGSIVDGGKQANSLVPGIVEGRGVAVEVVRIETIAARAGFEPTLIILTINGAELISVDASRDYLASLSGVRLIAPGWYADAEGPIGTRLADLLESIGFRVGLTPGRMVFAYR